MPVLLHHDGKAHGVHLRVLAGSQRLHDDVLRAVHDDLGGFKLAYALVVQDAVLRPEHPQLTGAEGLAGVAQLCQLGKHRLQALFVAVPAEEGTVEGVAVALHPDLITVVQAGHAGQRVDDGIGHAQAQHPFLVGFAGHTAAALPLAATAVGGLVRDHGEGAFGVVGGEKVQRSVHGRGGVVLTDGQNFAHGLLGGLTLYKVQHSVLEGVIHHAVQPLAQQIGAALAKAVFGGGVLPHLAQQELLRADPLDSGADLFNKVVRQLVGHIQTEACGTAPQPCVNDTALAGDELHIGGVLFVHLGQGLEAPPAAVAALILGVKIVPAAVGGVGVAVSAAVTIAAFAVEIAAVGTGVAEHTVQHDANAVLGGLAAEHLELLVGAQQRVYVEIVGGVVAVVGVRLKDGVEVKVVHPHLPQIGQFDADAFQVAAEIVLVQVAAGLVGLPEGFGVFVGLIQPVRERHGLVLNALAEPVREDLIEHLALDALRGLETGIVDGDLPLFAFLPADNAAVVRPAVDAAEVGVEVEVVEVQARVVQRQLHGKVVLLGGLAVELHAVVHRHVVFSLLLEHQMRIHIAQLFRDAKGQAYGLTGPQCAKGLLEIGVVAIEQTRQSRVVLSQKSPGGPNAAGADGFFRENYLPMGTGEAYQMSRA